MSNEIKTKLFYLFLGVMFIGLSLSAQSKKKSLVFNEIYLNESEPDESWLEIYNPSNNPLVLEKFRLYNVMTTNILPGEIRKNGGLEIAPGESIILCANSAKLNLNNAKIKVIQISVLGSFGKGGFFSLRTKGMGENGVDIVRYGDPKLTVTLQNQIGDYVIPFSSDSQSYSRIDDHYSFIRSEPSPGIHIRKGGQ
jgi:hypothetical protein